MDKEAVEPKRLYIVSGLSGAGKSTALRVFEDLNYFAVDGLPAGLAPDVAAIMERAPMRHFPGMAIGMDLRQDDFLSEFKGAMEKLRGLNLKTRLLFLEADNRALLLRYAATRRPHPLERKGLGLEAAAEAERRLLAPLREKADLVIDSTDFSIHDLRRVIQKDVAPREEGAKNTRVNVLSFGYKYGIPGDADFVFDLRFLDNPYFIDKLRPLSGKDKAVADYVLNNPLAREFKKKAMDLLSFSLRQMEDEGRYRVTAAFGCTGGRHRSVAMAEEFARLLREADYPVTLEHRNLHKDVETGDVQSGKENGV